MIMLKYILTLALSGLFLTAGAQQTIFVAPEGNDQGDGSLQNPLRSVEVALQKVRQATEPEVCVYLRGGTYYLTAPIQLTPEQLQGKKLTLAAWQDEAVTLSGGKKLALNWIKSKSGYWQCKVDPINFDQLFINGEKRIMARYPNYMENEIYNGTAADAISPERVKRWKNPEGGFIHAMHRGQWGDMHYLITGKTGKELSYTGGFQNNRPSPLHERYRFVENIREELDAPGEWFLDTKEQILYYYPIAGEQVANATVEVAVLPYLIEIKGTEANLLTNVAIRNIRFAHTRRTFMDTYEQLMRSDWCIHRGAAILMERTENCSVEQCEFTHLGGNALFLSRYNRDCTIKSNHIHHIGASAVCVVGDTSAVRSGSLEYGKFVPYEELDLTPGPKNELYPRQCRIEDNLIHDIGQVEKQVAGVEIQLAAQIQVSHNTIYRIPRAAINVGDGAFGGHLIEYNDAFETVLETSDHGAFNSWGRDRFWHPDYQTMTKLTNQHPELILLDALYTTVIRNNRFRCDHGWDIDLDDGSSNYHIYNNVCLYGGLKLREGFYRTVENNLVINNSFHPHVWFPNSGDVVQRNIFMQPYFPISLNGWGKKIDYNFFSTQQEFQNGTDAHSICGSLSFEDASKGIYTLPEGSEAFRIGYENIPMGHFGVYSPQLKKLAKQPDLPSPVLISRQDEKKEYEWLDAKVRIIDGLGDRSAYGLPDENGIIIVEVKAGGILDKAGIRKNDVMRTLDNVSLSKVEELFVLVAKNRWKGQLPVTIFRNQDTLEKRISFK